MKNLLILLISCSLFTPVYAHASETKSVNRQVLELLKQKQVVSEQQYQNLSSRLEAEEAKRLSVTYDKGLRLGTKNQNFQLKVNGRIENDFVWFDHGHPTNDNFTIRRAWLTINGRAYKYFGFKLQPDFSGSNRFQDASVDFNYSPKLKLRVGQVKTPFSLEWTMASKHRDFLFRSLAVFNLSPDRDRGIMAQGEVAQGTLNYAVSVMNGSRTGQNDPDKHKDLAGRLVLSPFKNSGITALRGLHFGGSVTYGRQNISMASNSGSWFGMGRLRNPASGTTFFQLNNGVTQNGARKRYGLETAWLNGPLSVKAEWIRVEMDDLSFNSRSGDFDINGYYMALGYFFTSEGQVLKKGNIGGITPLNNFDPSRNTWGAWQAVARYEEVEADDALLSKGYVDSSRYSKGAASYTLGLTWYPSGAFRIMFNYVHCRFDNSILAGNKRFDEEDTFLTRFQVSF